MNYEAFTKKIHDFYGLELSKYKEGQMKRRIETFIERKDLNNYDYFLNELRSDNDLKDRFFDYLTINVTEFFRNPKQWQVLDAKILPEIIKSKKSGIKVWSSACSSGEEPYSLVMLLNNFFDLKDIKVFATDIDTKIIEKAKRGVYSPHAIKNVPKELLNEHFKKERKKEGDFYILNQDIKDCVTFKKFDLLKDIYPKNYDLILCRNVMIYFKEDVKSDLLLKFKDSLSDEGVFFLGNSEQIINPQQYGLKLIDNYFYSKM